MFLYSIYPDKLVIFASNSYKQAILHGTWYAPLATSRVYKTPSLTHSSEDSMSRLIPPTRGIKRPICGTLKNNLVGATDLFGRPTNIVNLFIVLCSPTYH